MSERYNWANYVKAVGIILVVYVHVARGMYKAGIEYNNAIYLLADSAIYIFIMPLFFFLSGLFFIPSLKKRGAFGLFKNKLATIFYPYVVWSLLQGGIEVLLSNYTNGSLMIRQVISFM